MRNNSLYISLLSKNIIPQKDTIDLKVKDIEHLKTEITNQELDERNLNDNLELMKISQEEARHASLLQQLTKDIGDLDFRKMTAEKTRLLNKQNEMLSNQSKIEGQMSELKVSCIPISLLIHIAIVFPLP